MEHFVEFEDVCKYYQTGSVKIAAADHLNFYVDKGGVGEPEAVHTLHAHAFVGEELPEGYEFRAPRLERIRDRTGHDRVDPEPHGGVARPAGGRDELGRRKVESGQVNGGEFARHEGLRGRLERS